MAGQMVGMVSENKIEEALRYLSDKFNISVDVAIKKVDEAPKLHAGTTLTPTTTEESVTELINEVLIKKGTC